MDAKPHQNYVGVMITSNMINVHIIAELLEKAAAASSMALQSQIGNMLDSIICTTVPCNIHQWYNDILSSVEHGSKRPRGADI